MSFKTKRKILITALFAIIILLIVGLIYRTFFMPRYTGTGGIAGILILGLALGVAIGYLIRIAMKSKKQQPSTNVTSHTIVESIKRVFKIVVTESQINDIFNYENTKKLFMVIPSTKKALVIVNAKVMIGYDIAKCKWDIDEENKVIKLIEFPKPEILSLETDFNYYYFEDDLFNFIGRKDLQEIQYLAKEQVKKSILHSDLIRIAATQMKVLLNEVTSLNGWTINNMQLVDDYAYPIEESEEVTEIEEPTHILSRLKFIEKAAKYFK